MTSTPAVNAKATRAVESITSFVSAIDCFRGIAALAIVWIHTPQSEQLDSTVILGRFAVPFFVFSATYFAAVGGFKKSERTLWQYGVSRFRRLYLPFLFWTVAYLAFKGVKLLLAPDQQNDFPGWSVFLIGSAYHLWFLPFIFLGSFLVFTAAKCLPAKHPSIPIVSLLAGIVIAVVDSSNWPVPDGLKFMWQATPGLCWAVALAFADRSFPNRSRWPAAWFGIAFVLAMVTLTLAGRIVLLENAAGACLFAFALRCGNVKLPTALGGLAPLSFGIYLSHLLFIKTLETLANKLHLEASPTLDGIVFGCAVVGSALLTSWMLKFKPTAWMV